VAGAEKPLMRGPERTVINILAVSGSPFMEDGEFHTKSPIMH
jgi:hypothetical protein